MANECVNSSATDSYADKSLYLFACRELNYTLNSNSKSHGWKSAELRVAFADDAGVHPDALALRFGMANFDVLLKSDLLQPIVSITFDELGEVRYRAKGDPRIAHIVNADELSIHMATMKATKQEQEKFNRANLPENRGLMLEGRKRLSKVAYLLGAETRDVSLAELQAKYAEEYGNPLGREEIRRYFQRGSISKVLLTHCAREFELSAGETTHLIFLKLSRPYEEICQMFEAIERTQQEARRATLPLNDTRRLTTNRFRRRTNLDEDMRDGKPLPSIAVNRIASLPTTAARSSNVDLGHK